MWNTGYTAETGSGGREESDTMDIPGVGDRASNFGAL